jgi:glucosyltransferase
VATAFGPPVCVTRSCTWPLIGGVQTVLLGLIGEYLSRLYLEAKNRPLFVVSELINLETGKQRGA